MSALDRRELAYWLTLAFRLEGERRQAINGLVLTADRKAQLGLLDLVRLDVDARPPEIEKYAATLDRLLDAEGRVSAQAFLLDRLLTLGCQLVPITSDIYPPHLARRIGPERAPTVLTAVGDSDLWKVAGIAISGSRKAGPKGVDFAREAGRAIAAAGEVVVCGLAAGIDRAALEGALEAGGRVLGIAPEGLLHSRWLRRPEVAQGRLAIVSEFAPDARWSAGRAMARNRTIAGFSSSLIIADCVASGGTTDQLEVHRAAGLPVYVRTGTGQGALVDELCRRPGVTPWPWDNGAASWPPPGEPAAAGEAQSRESQSDASIECVVTLSPERVQIQVDAPRQLTLDEVLETVRGEYVRATDAQKYPTADAAPPLQTSDVAAPNAAPADPVAKCLARAGATGLTSKELVAETKLPVHRIRTRLREMTDARLVAKKKGHRYALVGQSDNSTLLGPIRNDDATSPRPRTGNLFSDMDLGS